MVNGISTGEVSTIDFFNRLFNKKFKKIRPKWLINPKTGMSLELDGYEESLKIAIEYGSHLPTGNKYIFKNQPYLRYKENLKRVQCKNNGVKLIEIPDLPLAKSNINETFHAIVAEQFKNLSIPLPKKFYKIKFIIREIPSTYSKDDVWVIAKKCKNRDEMERKFKGYWRAAERLGLIEEVRLYFQTFAKKRGNISLNQINADAKACKTRQEFSKRYPGSYKKAIRLDILDKICLKMKSRQLPFNYWKKNAYSTLKKMKSKSEVQKIPGLFGFVHNNRKSKEYNIYLKLEDKNSQRQWTYERALHIAKKHNSPSTWRKSHRASYEASKRKGFFDKVILSAFK